LKGVRFSPGDERNLEGRINLPGLVGGYSWGRSQKTLVQNEALERVGNLPNKGYRGDWEGRKFKGLKGGCDLSGVWGGSLLELEQVPGVAFFQGGEGGAVRDWGSVSTCSSRKLVPPGTPSRALSFF